MIESTQAILTLFWTVAFCLGWNLCLEEGNILHFILKPFVNLYDQIENAKQLYKTFEPNKYQRDLLFMQRILLFILTPIILCVTCMGSFWGVLWFVIINGFSSDYLPQIILNCFAASFIQTFIWNLYVRISN